MRNEIILMIACTLLISSCAPIITLKLFVKGEGLPTRYEDWLMDLNISDASIASFKGEALLRDLSGWSISLAGDVNGDCIDDILIGAPGNDEGGNDSGQTYLILGKASGWSLDISLSSADASFIGESTNDFSGCSVSGAGDVNGDGYDDILIGAYLNQEGGFDAGQTYLIFGKASGWTMDTRLDQADASYIGVEGECLGGSVSGAGDVNGDGYDDILFGAPSNEEGGFGAGQTYLIFGKASGWAMDTDSDQSDASFIGEAKNDNLGAVVSEAGEINGDGLYDILIGAPGNDDGGSFAGQTYLILGRSNGWSMDMDLSSADASFIGESARDESGTSVSGADDVNGDGLDDILIGADSNSEGGTLAGQTYLILGKESGWNMDVSLSTADASFIGETSYDWSGQCVSGAGDVNGDGLDDILIGAPGNDEGGNNFGQTYLILGKISGWSRDISLSSVDASFIGESSDDRSGVSISGGGDFNNDGNNDILIGAPQVVGNTTGKTYFISGIYGTGLLEINSIRTYNSKGYEIFCAELDEKICVELAGLDGNSSKIGFTYVEINSSISFPKGFTIKLIETGPDTGIFQGNFTISTNTDPIKRELKADIGETITITSIKDRTKFASLTVWAPVAIRPNGTDFTVLEDTKLKVQFVEFGYHPITDWSITVIQDSWGEADPDWFEWDRENLTLWGIPKDNNVGWFTVIVTATDGLGNYSIVEIKVDVINTPPHILTENVLTTDQNEYYFVDYETDDDISGYTHWMIEKPDRPWLEFNTTTGILNGTPGQSDVGTYPINISVSDGKGGLSWTSFDLEVADVNDPPKIVITPITTVNQSSRYIARFHLEDPDYPNDPKWELNTNASWLEMYAYIVPLDGLGQRITGIPTNDDIGRFFVNLSVTDSGGLSDFVNYTLEVIDINDAPTWTSVPLYPEIGQGELFKFDVNATDVDRKDEISYRVETSPDVDMTIDEQTGMLHWLASLEGLTPSPNYLVQVTLFASDGELEASDYFTLKVVPNPSPISTLLSPSDEELVLSTGALLKWEFEDDSDEVMFDVHLSEYYSYLFAPDRSTMVAEDLNATSLFVEGLMQGKSYFWTVLPKDKFSIGTCSNPIWKFRVNELPLIDPISPQIATVGLEWRLHLQGSDPETAKGLLEFSYISGPQGMELDADNEDIAWTPGADQIGDHTVIISLYDGLESSNLSFTVTVREVEERPDELDDNGFVSILIVVIAIIILMIIIGVVVFFIIRKKKGTNEKGTTPPVEESPITPEAPKEQPPPVAGSTQETIPPLSPDNTIVEETHIEGKEVSSPIQNN